MAIMTLCCSHGSHSQCPSKVCECECHKDLETLRKEAAQRRYRARELVIQALQDFQVNPDLPTTQTAILALQQYEQTLKEARRGR